MKTTSLYLYVVCPTHQCCCSHPCHRYCRGIVFGYLILVNSGTSKQRPSQHLNRLGELIKSHNMCLDPAQGIHQRPNQNLNRIREIVIVEASKQRPNQHLNRLMELIKGQNKSRMVSGNESEAKTKSEPTQGINQMPKRNMK